MPENTFHWPLDPDVDYVDTVVAPGHDMPGQGFPPIVRLCRKHGDDIIDEDETNARLSIEAEENACPGVSHPLTARFRPDRQIDAVQWSVIGGNGTVQGGPASNQANLLATPGEVTVLASVLDDGTFYKAVKKVFVHDLDFEFDEPFTSDNRVKCFASGDRTKFWVRSDGPTFKVEPPEVRVAINDAHCPHKDTCAARHEIGWLQTVTQNKRRYRMGETWWQTVVAPLPMRDAVTQNAPPWYDINAVRQFARNWDSQTVPHEDSPASLEIPWKNDDGKFEELKFENEFVAWLVVRNRDIAALEGQGEFPPNYRRGAISHFLCHINWQVKYAATIGAFGTITHDSKDDKRLLGRGLGRGPAEPVLSNAIPNFESWQVAEMNVEAEWF